ncbi:MAG TPA: LysM peptidoglycan-binding domain-containing protein [Candidatus Acidoferrum sp.]|jgi:LysM repeat protein|nr:LysM peptidoglycan-binding domain-containing protein [Candidatus Acidoferrum sp.]
MKRISFLLAALTLCAGPRLRAQDAGTEERFNKLAGQIEDLRAGQDALRRQLETVGKELDSLREQVNKPTGNYASQEDLKRVAEAVKDIDRKRIEDADKIHNDLLKLQKSLAVPPGPKPKPTPNENPTPDKLPVPDKGYEYIVKKGDTLSIIVQAYRDNNIKVTTDQILKANPGLKPERMKVGQKIFIPAPQP